MSKKLYFEGKHYPMTVYRNKVARMPKAVCRPIRRPEHEDTNCNKNYPDGADRNSENRGGYSAQVRAEVERRRADKIHYRPHTLDRRKGPCDYAEVMEPLPCVECGRKLCYDKILCPQCHKKAIRESQYSPWGKVLCLVPSCSNKRYSHPGGGGKKGKKRVYTRSYCQKHYNELNRRAIHARKASRRAEHD